MTTTPDTGFVPTDAEFSSWTEEAEDAAIRAAADGAQIQYVVGDSIFFGRFPDSRVIRTPLRFSAELLDRVAEVAGGGDERTQLKNLLQLLGQDDDVVYLQSADLVSVVDYAAKYFKVFERVIGISLGE